MRCLSSSGSLMVVAEVIVCSHSGRRSITKVTPSGGHVHRPPRRWTEPSRRRLPAKAYDLLLHARDAAVTRRRRRHGGLQVADRVLVLQARPHVGPRLAAITLPRALALAAVGPLVIDVELVVVQARAIDAGFHARTE